jgi:hypothetical protein
VAEAFLVFAVVPGLDHVFSHGGVEGAVARLEGIRRALEPASTASGTCVDGAWGSYALAEDAVRGALRAAGVGAGCGVGVGRVSEVRGGPPVGLASWQAARLAGVARTGETLMSRSTLGRLTQAVPEGVGRFDGPSALGPSMADVVVLKDFRVGVGSIG